MNNSPGSSIQPPPFPKKQSPASAPISLSSSQEECVNSVASVLGKLFAFSIIAWLLVPPAIVAGLLAGPTGAVCFAIAALTVGLFSVLLAPK